MRIFTESGEIGVYHNERAVKLRPSLYAMSQLGEPEELVLLLATVMCEAPDFINALSVIYACTDDDVSDLFGYIDENLQYVRGAAHIQHIVPLARCLLRHGMIGVSTEPARPPSKEPEYTTSFSARDHVAMAMAHLGMSEAEAWDMTMTSLVSALKSKFPPLDNEPGSKAPTAEQNAATMDWFDRVEAARKARQGAH